MYVKAIDNLIFALLFWISFGVRQHCCNAARILFSAATDTGTHIGSMIPLINRLAEDKHDVTVFETSSLKKARKFNAPNINVVFIQVPRDKNTSDLIANQIFREEIRANTLWFPFAMNDAKTLEFLRDTTNANTLREIINTNWDLVIIDELFGVHSFAIAMSLKNYRNTPYIVYSTTMMIHTTAHNLALGRNFVSEPYLLTALPNDNSDMYAASRLFNRLDNIYNILFDLYIVNYYVPAYYTRSMAALGIPNFSFHKLLAQSSWIFADYVTRLKYAFTEGTEIRHIDATCRFSTFLKGELAHFVDDASSLGTIYIAFGSYINWAYAPSTLINAYLEALDIFADYRIIFTYNGPMPLRPPGAHIRLTKWAPQMEILSHNKTLVFISHGGLKSWKEALCNALPVIYMPIFAEQSYNAKLALRMGYARVLNKFRIDKRKIINVLQDIFDDYAHFKHNAIRARSLFLDRPVSALDEASHAVRRILKSPTRSTHFARSALRQTTADVLYAVHFGLLALILFAIY